MDDSIVKVAHSTYRHTDQYLLNGIQHCVVFNIIIENIEQCNIHK